MVAAESTRGPGDVGGPGDVDAGAPAATAKISCSGVWKVFGENAGRFLAEHDFSPSYETLTEAGLIGAVRKEIQ